MLETYQVPVEPIVTGLNPAVQEAKEYLYSKGLTEREIQTIITQENGTELDLIPLVMYMTVIEQDKPIAFDISSLFSTPAYAKLTTKDVLLCSAAAIGADILWALGISDTTKWSKKAITKAFGTVAKRFLGPIGVAIAVVSFGVCLTQSA